ncbi:hypothetical protein EDC14_102034 [Hydrogenispora ethanolica]|uniref:Uncharacterized protein n=1 Tax=Hydrogenispora ethanolica TaxID=1082276 RepID=A0A4R1RD81_HYDET|nr:hypothetical protein [Hydrogenispora ethanolica]TCL63749.1 hypothetical protein EDC14_102034 [Hydrogenispora ethanolica]
MLTFLRRDTFIKDILVMLLIGTLASALFAGGFAMVTDQYFAKTVAGIMGDSGEYDLLFQVREELKGSLRRQLQQVANDKFPGATLKAGISVAGKATFFLTLPSEYRNREVFNNLGSVFADLPGDAGFSIMTEPRINISNVPRGVFDMVSRQVGQIPGVRFTYKDGSSIGVILKNTQLHETVAKQIKKLLARYQIIEVRLDSNHSQEELLTLGKKASQAIVGIKDLDLAKDVSTDGGGDNQYLVNTMSEIKNFMTAYAAEVLIKPNPGQDLAVGDLLALNGQNAKDIQPGKLLEPLEVVVKITAIDTAGIHGMIIQGDSSLLRDRTAYRVSAGDKIGQAVGTVEVSSRKAQLVYAMDQGIQLLTNVNSAIADYNNNSSSGAGLTVSGVEKVYHQLTQVQSALNGMAAGITGLSGKANQSGLNRTVRLISSVGDDLDFLARNFARVQVVENRFSTALNGLQGARLLMGSPLLQNSLGGDGGIGEKMELLNSQLRTVERAIRDRIGALDDFINRFNPVMSVLLSWRNKAKDLAQQIDNVGTVFTPGSANQQKLQELLGSTNEVLSKITGVNPADLKAGLNAVSDHVFGSDKIDLGALIAEMQRLRDSLPKMMDEEIGRTVTLIDKYIGGQTATGSRLQIFTKTGIDRQLVDAAIRDALGNNQVNIFSLPSGTIQFDIRSELFKILAEVRSTIAALVVLILWVLSFILDQSLVVSMLRMMGYSFFAKKKLKPDNVWLDRGYRLLQWLVNPANLYAGAMGCVWLVATFAMSGARIPYVNLFYVGIGGVVLGILISSLAEKINPVSKDEVMAGLSLGLPFKTIMREIVIPAGRPGLLQVLNRWKMIMK